MLGTEASLKTFARCCRICDGSRLSTDGRDKFRRVVQLDEKVAVQRIIGLEVGEKEPWRFDVEA